MTYNLPQRPSLRDEAVLAWCGPDEVHVGHVPRAVRITGIDRAVVAWAGSLDGVRTLDECVTDAGRHGVDAHSARAMITALEATGCLDDAAISPESLRDRDPLQRMDILSDSYAAGHAYGTARDAAIAIDRRARTSVNVLSCGPLARERIGQPLIALLRRSGVDHSSEVDADAPPDADLTVVAAVGHPWVAADLPVEGPHLPVAVGPTHSIVGPVIVPGITACRRCAALTATDEDPSWPMLSVQLAQSRPRRQPVPALDSSLAAAAVAHAALMAIGWIDARQAASAHSVELSVPGGAPRTLTRSPHPDCGCGAFAAQSPRAPGA